MFGVPLVGRLRRRLAGPGIWVCVGGGGGVTNRPGAGSRDCVGAVGGPRANILGTVSVFAGQEMSCDVKLCFYVRWCAENGGNAGI